MLRIHVFCFCCCFTLLLSLAPSAHSSSVPPLINYQGRITDTDSNPVTGTKKLTINIYNAVNGGSLLWGPQVFPAVPVISGYFNVILGPVETDGSGVALPAGDSITDAFIGGINCYLEVQVDTDPVVVPRQRILSAPFAIKSDDALTVQGRDIVNEYDTFIANNNTLVTYVSNGSAVYFCPKVIQDCRSSETIPACGGQLTTSNKCSPGLEETYMTFCSSTINCQLLGHLVQ